MQKLLLVNPPSEVYARSKIKAGITYVPQVSLAMLGAVAERDGHQVRVLDLAVSDGPLGELDEALRTFGPTVLGITVMTPNYGSAAEVAGRAKAACPGVLVVAGGAHASSLPEATVSEGPFDVAVVGEGEAALAELLAHPGKLSSIKGIAFRAADGSARRNPPRDPIADLDELPMPAWHLFDLSRYPASKLTSRRSPVGSIETSRGCPHRCIYCSHDIFGKRVRSKSPGRVLAEMEHAKRAGFRELHVWDDHFATNLRRAKELCRAIVDARLNLALNMFAGLRVDSVDEEFLHLLKRAGGYQVALAPETGSAELLKAIDKGITLDDCRRAFGYARKAGLSTIAFFMIALPGETPETIEQTIRFAIELSPDYAKVCFATPLPATELFRMLEDGGHIKTHDWSKYAFHNVSEVYDHPTMSWPELERYYQEFYRRFYLRPAYIWNRLVEGILTGQVVYDAYYALKTWLGGS